MDIDVTTLPQGLIDRLTPVLHEAARAGCSFVRVTHDPAAGFSALIDWHSDKWEMDAQDFRYLLGHMEQTVAALTP